MEERKDLRFNLFGEKYTIKFVDSIPVEPNAEPGTFYYGQNDRCKGLITVALLDREGKPLSEETVRLTALHEIVHAIFSSGAYSAENCNEALVEWCAKCLNQLIKTFK